MKLNGWQRLFVLGSAGCGVAILAAACLSWPMPPRLSRLAFSTLAEYARLLSPEDYGGLADAEAETRLLQAMGSKPFAFWNAPRSTENPTSSLTEFRVAAHRRLQEIEYRDLWKRRTRHVAIYAGLWVSLCGLLYSVGIAMAWVRRGFRDDANVE